LTSGNTNTPTAALAYLGAKYILENRVNWAEWTFII
jgi:hypothetical protein